MKDKRIVVLLKYYKGELNPFDGAALECALELGTKEVIALSMAPASALNAFESLTRLGVKCVLVSDVKYAGSDTLATGYVLAQAIKRLAPDLVFCGRQSVDGDTGQVPPMLAQRLGLSLISKVMKIDGDTVSTRAGASFTLSSGQIVTFEKIRTLRFPSMFSKLGKAEVWDNQTLGLDESKCGLVGSPTRVVKSYESEVGRRDCEFVKKERLSELIEKALQKQRVEKTLTQVELLEEAYFVGNVEKIACGIAKRTIALDPTGKTPEEFANELKEKRVETVLWEDSEELKTLASKVAVITGAGLCADCISFRVEKGELIMTRPALGGNVTADIVCKGGMAFATVRTVKHGGSEIIFSVGKGGVSELEKIQALAKEYGAEVCCSRIVADGGKLPYSAQVGLTGRTVCPKVYVAFGISGAVQHTCAIAGATTVIAVNTDKTARIFDYADYGIVEDIKNF
jgi:electron transfer flavoprotein alpha subunit